LPPDPSSSPQVRVVEHKRSKKLYALKYIDKARCIKQKAIANIIQERRLLEEVRRRCHSRPE
jgi:serine/threonine kinase 32